MNPIKFECPHCRAINAGDDSLHGQRVKSCSYRLTTQRLFVRRGWLARHVNELELYRVKDVVLDRGAAASVGLRHCHGAGRRRHHPEIHLVSVSSPTKVKELIRTNYRAARQREGVHPTEFMQSP